MSTLNSRRNRRRALLGIFTLGLAALVWWWLARHDQTLAGSTRLSGWTLFALFALLLAFNLRKKLSFLPLGSAYGWAQLHFYGGLLAAWLFLLHMHGLPGGTFEVLFALLFSLAIASGLVGLYISRRFPPQLRRDSESVIWERIPALRQQLTADAEAQLAEHIRARGLGPVTDFYRERLLGYLTGPADFWEHVLRPGRTEARWQQHFDALRAASEPHELALVDALQQQARSKAGLDLQLARRGLLKGWLFLHIPLSYALLCFVLLHVLLVYGYGGPSA